MIKSIFDIVVGYIKNLISAVADLILYIIRCLKSIKVLTAIGVMYLWYISLMQRYGIEMVSITAVIVIIAIFGIRTYEKIKGVTEPKNEIKVQ